MLGKDGSANPQPFGLCVQSCDPKQPKCPENTACTELFDTRTRQSQQQFVCAALVERGRSCLNGSACKEGTLCARFGLKRPHWFCLQECTQDDSVCDASERCVALPDQSGKKVCRLLRKVGERCTPAQTCEEKAACIQPGLDNFQARCQRRCRQDSDCSDKEACRFGTNTDSKGVQVCFQKAGARQSCRRGAACLQNDDLCVGLNGDFAACFKPCKDDKDCATNERCDTISTTSEVTACRLQVPAGNYSVNLAQCARGGQTVRLSDKQPPICLPDCTVDNLPAPAYCGHVSPYPLAALLEGDGKLRYAVGAGLVVQSTDEGKTWNRLPVLDNKNNLAIASYSGQKGFFVAGQSGRLFRYEHTDTWKVTRLDTGVSVDLYALLVNADGTLLLAAGDKGTLLRSDNSGKTWAAITTPVGTAPGFRGLQWLPTDGQTVPVALAVTDDGRILRSDDSGRTWGVVHTEKDGAFRGINARTGKNAAFDAVAMGDKGLLLTTKDGGRTWQKQTTSGEARYRTALLDSTVVLVAGDNGALLRWDGNNWKKQAFPTPDRLRSIFALLKPQNGPWMMSGDLGSVFLSEDKGQKWSETSSRLLTCLKITIPAAADAGVCVFRCDPARKGNDCPANLRACKPMTVAGKQEMVCQPPGPRVGKAGIGSRCNPYEGADASERCALGLECVVVRGERRCVQPCTQDSDCKDPRKCRYNRVLRRSLCTQEAAADKPCSPLTSTLCKKGLRCHFNEYTQKGVCVSDGGRKVNELCLTEDSLRWNCQDGLVCAGSAATPYRHFCTKTCKPGSQTCGDGLVCVPDQQLGGVCVQSCIDSKTSCQIKPLTCRSPFATSTKQYCL